MDLNYDKNGYAETTRIYLAKPGKRLLGVLNGVDETSVHLDINLQNTCELTFTLHRIVDGLLSSYYDIIAYNYELYMPNFGWFKITEEPELESDGNVETLSITAESLEIELQQYDLYSFEVNTANSNSLEYLAIDNTYMEDDFRFFRDQVLFYRDTTELEAAVNEFKSDTDGSIEDLKEFVLSHPVVLSSWRITVDTDEFPNTIRAAIDDYTEMSQALDPEEDAVEKERIDNIITTLSSLVENQSVFTQDDAIVLANMYDKIAAHIVINVDTSSDEEGTTYTATEVLERELQRQNELSLMTVLLSPHGWEIGHVDSYVDTSVPIEDRDLPLANRIGKFEVDSQDIYSFITQDVAQFYRCIFAFDTVNNLVNCFDINNVGFDTNIYLSFYNIMNSIERSSDEKIYTRFNVRGDDDLSITEVNFGDFFIEDISYYLNEKHFSDEFIEKYKYWEKYREKKRPQYIQLSKDRRNKVDEITELYDRVPLDGANPKQYSTFTDEQLQAEYANYKAELRGYRKFWGVETEDAEDEDKPLDDEGWWRLKQSDDWANYKLIYGVILDNIRIEMTNRGLDSSNDDLDFNEDYLYDFDNYGDSYGVAELETQKQVLEDKVNAIEDYAEAGHPADEYWASQHELYLKYKDALESCERVLKIRRDEYDDAVAELAAIDKKMSDLKWDVDKTNPRFGITEEELKLLDKYYNHTDYENENIAIYSNYTNEQIIDTQKKLLDEAFEELYASSHPQWSWTTTQDNLLLMPEFKNWHGVVLDKLSLRDQSTYRGKIIRNNPNVDLSDPKDAYNTWRFTDLWVGNYIRVGVREDDHNRSITTFLSNEDGDILINDVDEDTIGDRESMSENDVEDFLSAQTPTSNDVALLATRLTAFNHAWQVKLRITKISLNPMLTEPTIDIEFSNMIQYKSKRNDFAQLLDLASSKSKNQIKSTLRSQKTDNTFNIDSALVMKLISNSTFGSYMSSLSSGVVSNSVSAVAGSISSGNNGLSSVVNNLVANSIQSSYITADQITGTQGQFERLFTNYLDAGFIVTKMLEADEATIGELTAEIIRVGHDGITEITNDAISTATINADQINVTNAFVEDVLTIGTDTITTIAEGTITTDKVVAALVDADEGQFDELTADSAFIEYLNSGLIEVGTVDAGTVIAALVDADRGDFDNLTADTAFIEYLNSGIIEAGTVSADTVIAALVDAERGDFDNLTADSAFIQYLNSGVIESGIITTDTLIATMAQLTTAQVNSLTANDALIQRMQAVSSTTISQVVDQSYIHDLVAGHISVADLDAHTATADQIVLISSDGNPAIAFSNATQQFYDEDGNVRVQIGQDGNGDFNFIVRGADGTTALFNENGITQNGIPNSTIVNNMISDGTIQKGKLGFSIVEPNQQGGIDITQVYDGNGNLWGTEYTSFKQNTQQALEDLAQDIEDSANYDLYIETPNGTNIWGGNIQLNVKLLKNNVDVTDDFDASYFIWTRTSRDHDSDTYWNDQHSTGAKIITITANDVRMNADFQCKFEYENITVVSG